ncbi:hypothetical protein Q3157_18340 [Clostridioides difficile]
MLCLLKNGIIEIRVILTMWYVNFLNGAGIDEKAKCFRLTIWNVN